MPGSEIANDTYDVIAKENTNCVFVCVGLLSINCIDMYVMCSVDVALVCINVKLRLIILLSTSIH